MTTVKAPMPARREESEHRSEYQQAYDRYLETPSWKKKRDARLTRTAYPAPGVCWECGIRRATECHHITYDYCFFDGSLTYVAQERWWQLLPVCRPCHEAIEQRKALIAEQAHTANLESITIKRINWWASGEYGEYWWERVPLEEAVPAFDAYMAQQRAQSERNQIELERRQTKNKRKRAIKNLDFSADIFYQPRSNA